jgi:hypothetical protein
MSDVTRILATIEQGDPHAAADQYEQDAGYHRTVATLASGKQAWGYRTDRPAPGVS